MSRLKLMRAPRVLIVDDDPVQRMLLEASLKTLVAEVVAVGSGAEAVELFDERQPALVFLDILMPDMDGFQTCREMRTAPDSADAVIVMMTGSDSPESVEMAYEAGATDFVAKPLNMPVVLQRARYQLRAWDALRRLREGEARLRRAQELAQLGDWEMDAGAQSVRLSESCRRILGLERLAEESPVEDMLMHVHAADRSLLRTAHQKLAAGEDMSLEFRVASAGYEAGTFYIRGVPLRDDTGRVVGATGFIQDITLDKKVKAELRTLASRDELTGFVKCSSFRDYAQIALGRALSRGVGLALLMLDLDDFHAVNARYGYLFGDETLRRLAQRLRETVIGAALPHGAMRSPVFARVGGDELVIMVEGFGEHAQILPLIEDIQSAVRETADVLSERVDLSACLGAVIAPIDGEDVDTLQIRAEVALKRAKAEGRGRMAFAEATNPV